MSLILSHRDAMTILIERSEGALTGARAATSAFHLTACGRGKLLLPSP